VCTCEIKKKYNRQKKLKHKMGLHPEFRKILRKEVSEAFRRTKPPPDQMFDAAACDFEQLIFKLPPGNKSRFAVLNSTIHHLLSLAELCDMSMHGYTEQHKLPIVYAVFDSPERVTRAKEPCQIKRYATTKEDYPTDIKDYVKGYEDGMCVPCDWSAFIKYPQARSTIIKCLVTDLQSDGVTKAFDGKAVFILDPPFGSSYTEEGEAENKMQKLALMHEGYGIILDSSDTDMMAGWLLMGELNTTNKTEGEGIRYVKSVCLRSHVGGGKRTMTHSCMVTTIMSETGCTKEEAMVQLEEIGITQDTKEEEMPSEIPMKNVTLMEYADLNMIHYEMTKNSKYRGASYAFLGLMCGSDLVMGRHSNPIPSISANTVLSFYLDNYSEIGDLVKAERIDPFRMLYEFSYKAFWKLIRMLYWSKNVSKLKQFNNVIPTYIVIEKANRSTCKSGPRQCPSIKALITTFANCQYAANYYGRGTIQEPTATKSGNSLYGWYMDRNQVSLVPDWDHDLDGNKADVGEDEYRLYGQETLVKFSSEQLPLIYLSGPPPMSLEQKEPINRKRRSKSDSGNTKTTPADKSEPKPRPPKKPKTKRTIATTKKPKAKVVVVDDFKNDPFARFMDDDIIDDPVEKADLSIPYFITKKPEKSIPVKVDRTLVIDWDGVDVLTPTENVTGPLPPPVHIQSLPPPSSTIHIPVASPPDSPITDPEFDYDQAPAPVPSPSQKPKLQMQAIPGVWMRKAKRL
jgi:hypothetical protein